MKMEGDGQHRSDTRRLSRAGPRLARLPAVEDWGGERVGNATGGQRNGWAGD